MVFLQGEWGPVPAEVRALQQAAVVEGVAWEYCRQQGCPHAGWRLLLVLGVIWGMGAFHGARATVATTDDSAGEYYAKDAWNRREGPKGHVVLILNQRGGRREQGEWAMKG